MLLRNIIRYLPILFIGILANSALAEDPQPNNVWFKTKPPALHTNIGAGSAEPFTGSLKLGEIAYFNFYMDFVDGGTNQWYVDRNGTKTGCTVATDCASAILNIQSSGFTMCIENDLLDVPPIFAGSGKPLATEAEARRSSIMFGVCSDEETCTGQVIKRVDSNSGGAPSAEFGEGGQCFPNLTDGVRSGANGLEGKGVLIKGPLYIMIRNDSQPNVPSDYLKDLTIGVRIVGTGGHL